MGKRENIKATIEEIVAYWSEHEDESGLSVDFSEAHERCWRCGYKRKLERCHIVPASRGGEDISSNFVLLCKYCHKDAPNVTDPEIMWDWLKAYAVPFYNSFWYEMGAIEYEKIYGIKLIDELKTRNLTYKDIEEFDNLLKVTVPKTVRHFGSSYLNMATVAGCLRMVLKEYDKKYGLKTNKNVISLYTRAMMSSEEK